MRTPELFAYNMGLGYNILHYDRFAGLANGFRELTILEVYWYFLETNPVFLQQIEMTSVLCG